MADASALIERASTLHYALAKSHPALERGLVECRKCSRQQQVDSAQCLRHGWPKCHGATMSLVTQ